MVAVMLRPYGIFWISERMFKKFGEIVASENLVIYWLCRASGFDMQSRKKTSKFVHLFLFPFFLCLVGGVLHVTVGGMALAQTAQDRRAEADRLNTLGTQQFYVKDPRAIQSFRSALEIYKSIKDLKGEMTVLFNLGFVLKDTSQVIESRERSLAIAKQIDHRNGKLNAISYLIYSYLDIDQLEKTRNLVLELRQYLESEMMSINAVFNNSNKQNALAHQNALVTMNLATSRLGIPSISQEYQQYINRSLQNSNQQSPPQPSTKGEELMLAGMNQIEKKDFRSALQSYKLALDFYRVSNNLQKVGLMLYLVGDTYFKLGEVDKAVQSLEQSQATARQIGDNITEMLSFPILSTVYSQRGETSKLNVISNQLSGASAMLQQGFYLQGNRVEWREDERELSVISMDDSRDINDPFFQVSPNRAADIIVDIAESKSDRGEQQGSLLLAQTALEKYRLAKNREGEGNTLNIIGNTYNSLGQYAKAINSFQQALIVKRRLNNPEGQALAFNGLGEAHYRLGKYQQAIDFFQKSLAIKMTKDEYIGRDRVVKATNGLGNSYYKLGQYQKAADIFQEAFESASFFKANSFNSAGRALSKIGKYQQAIDYHQKALALARREGDRLDGAVSLNELGNIYDKLGDFSKAKDFYQQSLAIAKQISDREAEGSALSNLAVISAKLKQINLSILYYKQAINTYEFIRKDIRKLEKEYQLSYLATVSSNYRILADLLLQQNRIIEALQVLDLLKVQELEDYLKNIKGSDRSAQGVRLLAPELAISDKLLAVSFDNASALNQQLANQIQQLPKTEINKVPDYLNQIPNRTVLLYPFILGDRLEIILFAPNNVPIRRTVKIAGAELKELTDDFRNDLLDSYFFDVKSSAAKLYEILIKPIETDLVQFDTKTILYAPDGQLRYVPLSALYDGKQWLAEKYQISNLIAYTLTDLRHSSRNLQPNILAGAFGGKAGEKKFGEDGLPATIIEVDKITDYFQDRAIALKENQFSRQAVESKFKNHNVLHFATHAALNSGNPDQSYIIFGNGDRIHLNEIDDWQLPNMELMVLSACQTGFSEIANGIEILGFGYQLQKAGVKNSIASLWKVKDEGTQVLMDNFYSSLQKGNVTVSEALQQAQVSLIQSKDYDHPYYWSAFFAIGNGL
jgi:CHAT domain-containing protein/Flp pilus assembly protein TadD